MSWLKKEKFPVLNASNVADIFRSLPWIDLMGHDSDVKMLGTTKVLKNYFDHIGRWDLIRYQSLIEQATMLNGRQKVIEDKVLTLDVVRIEQIIENEAAFMYGVSRYVSGDNLNTRYRESSISEPLYLGIEGWLQELSAELIQLLRHAGIDMTPYNAILADDTGILSVTDICHHLDKLRPLR